ncbi:MAG TPA: HAMP domain-containing sensor histidine kinase [Candidatus Binatia bacterium]
MPALGNLPVKSTVVLIRWPVVLISSSLILYRSDALQMPPLLDAVVIFYALSNVGLYFMDESVFRNLKFNVLLVGVDTLVLTASLIINGKIEANFYLAYFLLIIVCSIFENPRMIAIVSLVAPFAYAGFFFEPADYHPGNYLQLAFLFVVGLFYGHFSQLVRTQRLLSERAEQRNQAKTELLNILSHELKTPLTVIGSYTQALKSAALGEINRDQEEALSKVLRQTENLENIVNVILDSASVETGAVAVSIEELVLSEFLDELKQNFESIVVGPNVKLVWDYPVPMPVVMSDPGKLKIILQNLINNAVKFTDAGEIRVAARLHPQRQTMEFTVSDTGIGIASDQLPFLFDKFWQVDAARTRTQSGIGMGLYIVKAFTELLRGTITVNSTPGMGSEFRVDLPTV